MQLPINEPCYSETVSNKARYNSSTCKSLLRGLSCPNSINTSLRTAVNERPAETDNDASLVVLKRLLGIIEAFMVSTLDRQL